MMQSNVLAFMSEPQNYPGGVEEVTRMETHGAIIFLAGGYAYKIKREVRLAYLDYSTLEKRHYMAQRELKINRRTAPELYLDIFSINHDPKGKLSMGGVGQPVEWVLKMKRFCQDDLFSNIARSGTMSDQQISQLAGMIAEFHNRLPPDTAADGYAKLERIRSSLVRTFDNAGEGVAKRQTDQYLHDLGTRLDSLRPRLRSRGTRGFIRKCHGDMHLQNIVLLKGVPTLFDAIEFDDDIATIDIFYDLAFLLMDLIFTGLPPQSNLLFNEYLRVFGDDENLSGVRLISLFISLRAAIRAMVGIDRLPHLGGVQKERELRQINQYLALAETALQITEPSLTLLGGLSGTGKSTMARALASRIPPLPGAVHLRSDVERKTMFGVAPTERLADDCYAEEYSSEVYKIMRRKVATILDAGHSVIVDAVFLDPEHRQMFETLANGHTIELRKIWLHAAPETLMARVDARRNDASDADSAVVKSQLDVDTAPGDWTRIDAGGKPEHVLERIMETFDIPDETTPVKQSA